MIKPVLPELALPKKDFRIKNIENKWFIYDSLSGQYRSLTPEEWVRQHWSSYLIDHLNYPKTLCAHEFSFTLFETQKRADFVLFSPKKEARVLLECKAPYVDLNEAILEQVIRYNMALQSPYLIVSNGLFHYCFFVDLKTKKINRRDHIPDYKEVLAFFSQKD